MPSSPPRRILVVRPDRIGDVVLTTPLVEALRAAYPEARVEALLAPRVAPLAAAIPGLDGALEDPGEFFLLAGRLRDRGYDLAVFPYGSHRHVGAAALARIPRRVGNGLRPYAALLTDRVRVHRSRPPLHEVDYCLRLLEPLGIEPSTAPRPRLAATGSARLAARTLLTARGLDPGGFVLVHPGGGGSAGRPSPETFRKLALAARDAALPGAPLWVSAGPGEERLARGVGGRLLPPIEDLLVYLALAGMAGLYLAGSTGPLHLAAAAGAPALGFYPWKASQTAARWGPRGARALALSPPPEACPHCRAGTCTASACFERIPPEAVAAAARQVTTHLRGSA